MQQRFTIIASFIGLVGYVFVPLAQADVIEVESFHLGGFYALPDVGDPIMPDNDPSFQNYFLGHTTVSGFKTTERRTFFAFDLSSITIPDGETIVGVDFTLELIFGGILANFTDGMEDAVFTSSPMDYSVFSDPDSSGFGPDEIFEAMGTGPVYSGVGFDEMVEAGPIIMPMSDMAITDMLDNIADGTAPFVITGRMDTYDPAPDAEFEFLFGLSDVVVDGSPTGFPVPKLTITTAPVPAPSTLALLGLGTLGLNRRNRH